MRNSMLLGIGLLLLLCTTVGAQTAIPITRYSVRDINGRAISLVRPVFSETAVARADGSGVTLKIVVDEKGDVIFVQCLINCHPMLKDAAEIAAATSKFRPLLVNDGHAVTSEGILIYSFVVDRIDWFRFGTTLESTRQFDNLLLAPAADILSMDFADEKGRLIALDVKGVDLETRWKVIREVEASLKDKLKGGELWKFNMGMALRRVTFWTSVSERIKRDDLQTAIDDLPKFVAGASDGIPEETIEALTVVSKYRVPAELSDGQLRQAISKMTRSIRIVQ